MLLYHQPRKFQKTRILCLQSAGEVIRLLVLNNDSLENVLSPFTCPFSTLLKVLESLYYVLPFAKIFTIPL